MAKDKCTWEQSKENKTTFYLDCLEDSYEFSDLQASPVESGWRFCPYCGRPVGTKKAIQ